MKIRQLWCVLAFLPVFVVAGACAAELEFKPDRNYQISITPYAWLLDLKGTVGARGYHTDVDARFSSSAKHVNFAAMLAVDAVFKNSYGISANLNLAMLSASGGVGGISLDGNSSLLLSDVAGFYRVASFSLSRCAVLDFDVLAGVRLWRAGLKLNVDLPGGRRQYGQNEFWADPVWEPGPSCGLATAGASGRGPAGEAFPFPPEKPGMPPPLSAIRSATTSA